MNPDPEIIGKLGLSDFIALDIETTGLNASEDQIIEIGATKFHSCEPGESFESFVRPSIKIPKFITKLTGISDHDVADAPEYHEVMSEFIDFCGDRPLIAHNSPFDMKFLRTWAAKAGAESTGRSEKPQSYFKNDVYDTALLSRIFFWWVNNHKLVTLAEYFGFDESNAHRASSDAERAGYLFVKVLERMLESSYKSISTLHRLFEGTNNSSRKLFYALSGLLNDGKIREGMEQLPTDLKRMRSNVIGKTTSVQLDAAPKLEYINPKEVKAIFQVDGEISLNLKEYEERPQQEDMAFTIAEAFNAGQMLAIEAGTGVGKTLAYLVPSIMWARNNRPAGQRVVISTRTKNLQDQLFNKDIPFLHETLPIPFKAVLLKGRNNYLCLTKYYQAIMDPGNWLTEEERISIAPIVTWINHTKTGDIEENHGFNRNRSYSLWNKISAESGKCSKMKCKQYNGCYLGNVRDAAATADIIVVNHSLLLSDAVTNNQVLNEYQNLVIDEAHNLEKDAWQFLGEELSVWQIKRILSGIHEKDSTGRGAIDRLARIVQSLKSLDKMETILRNIEKVIDQTDKTELTATELFSNLNKIPDWVPKTRNRYAAKLRYKNEDQFFDSVSLNVDQFIQAAGILGSLIKQLLEIIMDIPMGSDKNGEEAFMDVQSEYEKLVNFIELSERLFEASDQDYVYWVELPTKTDSLDVRLFAVPLNMADALNEHLYSGLRCAIFTSATLAVAGSFNYFLERTGVELTDPEKLKYKEVGSPFNYSEQAQIGITAYMPAPNSDEFIDQAANLISDINATYRKGTLVLFTSYGMMNRFYDSLEPDYRKLGLSLLGQGKDGSRFVLQEKMKKEMGSTLLGTDSFWEGFDVQGDALNLLVITKLPFLVPTEPIVLAIEEKLKSEGKNAFTSYSIPEAIIKFRQGFGRLIRSKSDRGTILILDNRLSNKMYGKTFLKSLPSETQVLQSSDAVLEWIAGFNN